MRTLNMDVQQQRHGTIAIAMYAQDVHAERRMTRQVLTRSFDVMMRFSLLRSRAHKKMTRKYNVTKSSLECALRR